MNLIACLPRVASYIYRRTYCNNDQIEPLKGADWSANFAHMMAYDGTEIYALMRLYLTIHADHEGGKVSAHATHLVDAALSDAYYSFSSGLNDLAGPLHGLANQEVIRWILDLQKDLGGGLLFIHKVRKTMKFNEDYPMKGTVNVDEFVVGGYEEGKPGRSYDSTKKKAVCALEPTEEGKVKRFYTFKIPGYSAKSLRKIFEKHVDKNAKITTDK